MSQIVRCCECDQRVRIPDINSDAWVRCPLCREEFPLSRIAIDLPPRLEVVDEGAGIVDSTVPPDGDIDLSDPAAPTRALANVVPNLNVRPAAPTEDDLESIGRSVPSPSNLHADRNKGRNSFAGIRAAAKIVLGGIAGLMIGQIILWWLPAPYQSDPLTLAPTVPVSLHALLPPNLRTDTAVQLSKQAATPPPTATDHQETSVLPIIVTPPVAAPILSGISGGPYVPPTDLSYSLRTAKAEATALDAFKTPDEKHVELWYGSLQNLAFRITNISTIESVNVEVIADLREFLNETSSVQEKFDNIGRLATRQLAVNPLQSRNGIALAGTVEGIRSAGELFRTTILLAHSGTSVDLISRTDPREPQLYQQGDDILALGVVLIDPENLQGYKGQAKPVVFGGFPIKVP